MHGRNYRRGRVIHPPLLAQADRGHRHRSNRVAVVQNT